MAEIGRIWLSGGWVMIPLFILAVLLYSQAFGLILYVRRAGLPAGEEMHWWDWVRHPETSHGRTAKVIEFTQHDVETATDVRNRFDEVRIALVGSIEQRTRFVSTLVAAAPLMGLLGTVIGMLQTFLGISTSGGTETAGVVAAGISEALVTTQTGLVIALPGLFIVMLIARQRQALEAKLMRLESLTLGHLKLEEA
jgi:biopolymer transport protein ExbB